jgi:1-acyl-sn-glycerol-3-phosphate acyltransferase
VATPLRLTTAARRMITIPACILATAGVTFSLPLWLPVAWLLSRFEPLKGFLRSSLFVTGYLWCECIGIVMSFFIWCRHGFCRRGTSRYMAFLEDNFRLQCWWASTLRRLAERLFRLRFQVTGNDALSGPSVIFVPRHTSIGDTVLPIVFYAEPLGRRLRFVLKRELLMDPCLDIVGNRLRNYFIDRGAIDPEAEIRGVLGLLEDIGSDGILIYPEGSRFSIEKRERILEGSGPDLAPARAWSHLLPPRYGGIMALLEHNPGLDLLFCAHVGFEGSSHVRSLINGSWLGALIRVHFWRVPFAEIPTTAAERKAFVVECWNRMHGHVLDLTNGIPAGPRDSIGLSELPGSSSIS